MAQLIKVIGDTTHGGLDSTTQAPVKVGGVGRTANPSAVLDGQRVSASFDKVGRQLLVPYQMRDLVATASAAPTYGTELTLLAGAAGVFHDLMEVTAANTSTQAFTVNLRSETGGGIVKVINIPANNTITIRFPVPVPQNTAAATWTVAINNPVADQPDPGVTVSATLIKNI